MLRGLLLQGDHVGLRELIQLSYRSDDEPTGFLNISCAHNKQPRIYIGYDAK